MSDQPNVIVIGGGAVGVCAAYFLAAHGHAVTLLERGQICSGCSHGNAGLIVPSHSVPLAAPGMVTKGLKWMFDPESPFYIKPRLDFDLIAWLWRFWLAGTAGQMHRGIPLIRDLSLASLRLFDMFSRIDGLDFGYTKKGLLLVFGNDEGFQAGRHEAHMLGAYGIDTTIMTAEEVKALLPAVHPSVVGAVHYTQDAHITPQRFVGGLAQYLKSNGVDVRESTEVLGFDARDDLITTVKTTRGDMPAGEVVLTSGVWSRDLGGLLGISLPIQPAKGYSITIKRPADWPDMPMVLNEAKVGVTPMMETLRFAGTLELAGFDPSINRRRVEAIRKAVTRDLPGLRIADEDVTEIWRGWRPCTPDGLPFLGRVRSFRNLTIAAGHAMIGVSLGPITGKLVSQIVGGDKPDFNLDAMRVERFI